MKELLEKMFMQFAADPFKVIAFCCFITIGVVGKVLHGKLEEAHEQTRTAYQDCNQQTRSLENFYTQRCDSISRAYESKYIVLLESFTDIERDTRRLKREVKKL